ncbi:MAG: hypothetical protein ACLVIP_04530 [Ruminococcus sp.]
MLEAGKESGLPKACELAILGESEEAVEECSKIQTIIMKMM